MESPLKVLVVDDEYVIREMLAKALSEEGFQVEVRATTEMLLAEIPSINPHLIILDLAFPGDDGRKFLSRLKSIEKFACIPVLIISGKAMGEDEIAALEALGAYEVVHKPFEIAELIGKVRESLTGAPVRGW